METKLIHKLEKEEIEKLIINIINENVEGKLSLEFRKLFWNTIVCNSENIKEIGSDGDKYYLLISLKEE